MVRCVEGVPPAGEGAGVGVAPPVAGGEGEPLLFMEALPRSEREGVRVSAATVAVGAPGVPDTERDAEGEPEPLAQGVGEGDGGALREAEGDAVGGMEPPVARMDRVAAAEAMPAPEGVPAPGEPLPLRLGEGQGLAEGEAAGVRDGAGVSEGAREAEGLPEGEAAAEGSAPALTVPVALPPLGDAVCDGEPLSVARLLALRDALATAEAVAPAATVGAAESVPLTVPTSALGGADREPHSLRDALGVLHGEGGALLDATAPREGERRGERDALGVCVAEGNAGVGVPGLCVLVAAHVYTPGVGVGATEAEMRDAALIEVRALLDKEAVAVEVAVAVAVSESAAARARRKRKNIKFMATLRCGYECSSYVFGSRGSRGWSRPGGGGPDLWPAGTTAVTHFGGGPGAGHVFPGRITFRREAPSTQ